MNKRRACPEEQREHRSKLRRRGFTLIELLIVIGIIMILAALVIVNVNNARARGRDSKRISDLSTIQLALEQYREKNGGYPTTLGSTAPSQSNCFVTSDVATEGGACSNYSGEVNSWASFQDKLKDYVYPLPKDPSNGKSYTDEVPEVKNYRYTYASDGKDYKLIVRLEDDSQKMTTDGGVYPVNTTINSGCTAYFGERYELFTLNAQKWTKCGNMK